MMVTHDIKIANISEKNLDELEGLCIPEDELDNPLFIEGKSLWKRWMKKNLEIYDSIGKLAYIDSILSGSIHYIPKPNEKVVEIKCIYAKENEYNGEIKQALLNETIKEFQRFKSYFDHEPARALVTYAFPVPKSTGELDFYSRNGFEQVSEGDKYFLYYPLRKDCVYIPKPNTLPIGSTDKDKVLIYCNSSCPYCVKEMMEILDEVRKLNNISPTKIVVPFEETQELSHIFSMPTCVVINDHVIEYSLMEYDDFVRSLEELIMSQELESKERSSVLMEEHCLIKKD